MPQKTPKKQFLTERIMISITPDELKRVEQHAKRMSETTGMQVSQSAASRALLLTSLRAVETAPSKPVRK